MRTIKFRAKACNEKKGWVYGSLIVENDESIIIQEEKTQTRWPCDDETMGEYTGLKDKNGIEIYEGDIFRNSLWRNEKRGYPYVQGGVGIVKYEKGTFIVECPKKKKTKTKRLSLINSKNGVIGNIYEDKKLLK